MRENTSIPHISWLPGLLGSCRQLCLFLWLLVLLCQCSSPAEKARKELKKRLLEPNAATAVLHAQAGDMPVLELLEKAGYNFAERDRLGLTPLLAAAQINTEALPFLIANTPASALDAADGTGRTALSYVWQHRRRDYFLMLLDRGAKPDQTQHPGKALLASILESDSETAASRAIAACSEASSVFPAAMVAAALSHHEVWLNALLAKKASGQVLLPVKTEQGASAHISLFRQSLELGRSLEFLEKLHAAGAVVSSPANGDAMNPLDFAVARKDLPLATKLLSWKVDPILPTPKKMPPMDTVIQEKQWPLVKLFLENGVSSAPYLPKALAQGNVELLELFQQLGWKPTATVDVAATHDVSRPILPIHYAVEVKNGQTIQWLLKMGVDATVPGWHGQDSFVAALLTGDPALVKPFLGAGYDPNRPLVPSGNNTKMFPSITGSDFFNTWYEKDKGLTPLMLAAAKGQDVLVEMLMKSGAKRGASTEGWKRFAVNFACETENIRCAQLLLGRESGDKRNVRIVVSLGDQRATIFKDGKAIRSTTISSGRSDFPTPRGQFVISDKQVDWMSSIYKVPMPFFMRLSCKDFGLHEGYTGSRNASHGCIRLPKEQAPEFFKIMKIGDQVTVQ